MNGLHNNKGLNTPHPTTQFVPMQLTNGDPRSGHCLQLPSRPGEELRVSDWPGVLSCSVVTGAPVEEVNSDGKANLDILSAVKYGKELLNEQLIPGRYHVPART